MYSDDIAAWWLTLKLATLVTLILLVLSTPIALWLAHTQSRSKGWIAALIALPLVLPPTVLGFYLLIIMGPEGWLGQLSSAIGSTSLSFSFEGVVLASTIYSLPFVVQPLYNAFSAMGNGPLEVAATLRAGPIDRFFHVILPLSKSGYVTAAILCFAHTLGEFGVVLMVGGSIPGETRVLSVQIYDHVEALNYSKAHMLSASVLLFSFVMLLMIHWQSANKK